MDAFHITLFHRLQVRCGDQPVAVVGSKVQELFCYLILFRGKAHPREALAEMLWGSTAPQHGRRYLRKAVWQLQDALDGGEKSAEPLLQVDADWIQLQIGARAWLDIAAFEDAYFSVQGLLGRALNERQVQQVRAATDLYTGDLLEGWYQDWCLYERQRFQFMYLAMLDKLVGYCQANQHYEAGINYCARAMQHVPARERTHRQLMRLYYRAGDRNAALEQYAHCVDILREELDVEPDKRTQDLYRVICSGSAQQPALQLELDAPTANPGLAAIATHLEQLRDSLAAMQSEVEGDLRLLKQILG